MLKRILLTIAPVAMIFGTVSASDDLLNQLASMEMDSIVAVDTDQTDLDLAGIALEDEDDFGQNDVDALLGEDDKDEDAIAACFRRVGYGYGRSYGGYRNYGYSYNYYRPTYSYNYSCYRPVTYSYHHPVTYHVPVYTSYWSCY